VTPAQEALASWTIPPYFTATVLIFAAVYVRGFRRLRVQMPRRFPPWRLWAYLGGIGALLIAISSPLAAFDDLLLQVHMVQHMLLMFVAPPLILLGAPAIPLLRGLPRAIAKGAIGPLLKWRPLRALGDFLAHPVVDWLALFIATWVWHIPGPYQLALRSEGWHQVEHACFIAGAMLFWWPVVQPWPSAPRWPRWTMVPYLLLAEVQNSVLSALLIFSGRLVYPYYEHMPRLAGITPMNDQIVAGAIMWVPGSLFFLIPGAVIISNLLAPARATLLRAAPGAKASFRLGPRPDGTQSSPPGARG
jgi:putative membrane protein